MLVVNACRVMAHAFTEPLKPRPHASVFVWFCEGDADKPSGFRSVKAPTTKIGSSMGNAEKLPVCDKCGSGIV